MKFQCQQCCFSDVFQKTDKRVGVPGCYVVGISYACDSAINKNATENMLQGL